MGIMDTGMVAKIPADQFAIPRPFVFRIGSGMDSYKTPSCLDVPLKIGLLVPIQDVACGAEENYGTVLSEVRFVEVPGIGGGIHIKAIILPEFLDRGNARRDGF